MNKYLSLFKKPSSYFYFFASIFLILLILKEIHFFSFMKNFLNTLKPLGIGILISFFMHPFMNFNNTKLKVTRVIFVYFVFMILFFLFIALFMYLLVMNIPSILNLLQEIYPKIMTFIEKYHLNKYFNFEILNYLVVNGYEIIFPMIKNMILFFSTFAFSLTIAFFISLESHIFVNRFKSYVKDYEKYFRIYDIFSKILKEYVKSTLLDIVYIIITTSIILFMFKTPYAIMLSVLLAFFNLFPYIGALIGSVLLILIHFLFVRKNTLGLFIVILINSQIESNIVHTWICHKTMKIHPLFLFIGILINEYLFGIIGIILSPILAGMIQLAILTYSEYLSQKNIGGWENILS